jgi:hypothetical protein
MVKEAKFFRKQADKAETAARATRDAEAAEELLALALAYRDQAAVIKRTQKKQQKPQDPKLPKKVGSAKTKPKRKPYA